MRAIERAVRAELRALGVDLATEVLGRVAVDHAARLDDRPTDRDATALSRELRQVLGDLYRRHGAEGGDLDAFVAGISAAALRDR